MTKKTKKKTPRPTQPPRRPDRPSGGRPGKQLVAPLDDTVERGRLPAPKPPPKPSRPAVSGRPGSLPAFARLELRQDLTPPHAEWGLLVPIAKLGKTWGVQGHNTVRLYNADSDMPWAADVMLVRGDGFPLVAVEIDEWVVKGSQVLIRLVGIRDPQLAKQIVNLELLCHPDELPPAPDDEIYVHELIGMAVIDVERGLLGQVVDVMSTASNDIWVVRGPEEETLIPALKDFVLSIDRDKREIQVRYEMI